MTADSKQNSSYKVSDILEYLKAHPDFFIQHPEALELVNLEHNSGKAVSLIEKQVEHLRDVNKGLRAELARLIRVARDNDRISEATHRLSLEIMQSDSEDSVLAEVKRQMQNTFNVDYCEIIDSNNIAKDVLGKIKQKLNSDNIFLGRLGEECQAEILTAKADKIKSVAIVYLKIATGDKLFVLGSKDSDRYQEGIGTHFLLQLGDLIVISLYQKYNRK